MAATPVPRTGSTRSAAAGEESPPCRPATTPRSPSCGAACLHALHLDEKVHCLKSPRQTGSSPKRRCGRRSAARRHRARSAAADPLPGKRRSSLLLRLPGPPPRFLLSEFVCPSDRTVSKDTCVGGGGAISPPIAPPPPQRPPLGLLPEPHRARVNGVSSAHHEEVGGHLASSASGPGSTGPGPHGRCQKAPVYHCTYIRIYTECQRYHSDGNPTRIL